MNEYKIYVIKSRSNPDLQYIGSTKKSIKERLSVHCYNYKSYLNGVYSYTTSFDILKYNDYYIELYCDTGTDDKSDAHWFEGQVIIAETCVNKYIPGRTCEEYYKEYYENNKDRISELKKAYYEKNKDRIKEYLETNKNIIKEYKKQYRQQNKDRIKQYNKTKYICECSGRYSMNHRAQHYKTKKHISFIS